MHNGIEMCKDYKIYYELTFTVDTAKHFLNWNLVCDFYKSFLFRLRDFVFEIET